MAAFRITKYDPEKRDADGRFLADDWTSVSDVGESFQGVTLTLVDYLRIEDDYVETVCKFLSSAGISSLQVKDAERKSGDHHLPEKLESDMAGKVRFFAENATLRGTDIQWAVRLNLRELFWCRLEGDRGVYAHFGYDYYIYLGLKDVDFILPSIPSTMFAELCESPYKA
jgi:hypothetical protein